MISYWHAVMLVLGLGLGIQVLLGLGLGLDVRRSRPDAIMLYTCVIFLGVYCLAFFFVNCHKQQ